MKKIFLFVCIGLLTLNGYSQKKKAAAKKPAATVAALPKLDNLQVEVKGGKFQIAIVEKGKPADAMVVKEDVTGFQPKDCKLNSFMASGVKLYLLTWTEINTITTGDKTEERTTVYSVIYEIAAKKQVFSNYQLTNHITEKVFLDKLRTASETQEKIRREGFEFVLNPDGSITQKSKTQQNTMFYNKEKMEFGKK
ncbi:MAG: hypothetical protein M0D53_17665 [Flavobacterium sp. JAD_PAG50586_2]|nr:MAG: hypothetical protein M0D53_17665 [Flavobacterium sp. JAD_PAG50586_2]